MSELRKKIAEAIAVSDAMGCGCCSNAKVTEEQRQAAIDWNIDQDSIYLADEVLEVINA